MGEFLAKAQRRKVRKDSSQGGVWYDFDQYLSAFQNIPT
jgi:hypothetical protein